MKCLLSQLIQSAKIYVCILISWRSVITFGIAALGAFLYYQISWMNLQVFLAKIIKALFTFFGNSAIQVDNYLFIEGFSFRITNCCTYANRMLIGIPFILRMDTIGRNVMRIFVFVGIVFVVNVLRIYFALTWYMQGVSWKYSHTLFTHIISWLTLATVVILWLRCLKNEVS